MSAESQSTEMLPGFIDLQINGAFGLDFTTQPTSIWEVGRRLPCFGVTAFLPTIISCHDQQRHAAYAAVRARPDDYIGAEPLGLHLEGPLLADSKAGVHPVAAIADAVSRFEQVVDEIVANAEVVSMVTLAPELSGAMTAIKRLVESGVVVSLGHSAATESVASQAFDAGATSVTHVFNAMTPIHHREVGLVGAALGDNRVTIGLIADNRHVTPSAMRLVWRLVGTYRLALVSDAVAGLGAPPGRYPISGQMVNCDDDARTDDGELAGSLLDLPTAATNLRAAVGEAWQTRSSVPEDPIAHVLAGNQARLLGDETRGAAGTDLEGQRGDLVLVDECNRPVVTYIGGREVWRHPKAKDWA